MSKAVHPAERLLDEAIDVNTPIFLDSTSWDYFRKWIADRLPQFKARIEKGLTLWVFEAEFAKTQPRLFNKYKEQQSTLDELEDIPIGLQLEDELGIRFLDDHLPEDSDEYVYEIQQIYFHDEINPRLRTTHAEFMLLGRRAARNEPNLRILTAFPAFQRTINAEVFVLPNSIEIAELPADFDVFVDLGIHHQLQKVVSSKFYQSDYVGVVQDGVQELFGYLQSLDSGFTGIDGWQLVEKALGYQNVVYPRNANLPASPQIKLSPFITGSEKEDHKGYYHFIGGTYSAFRNISGHNPPSSQVRIQRFDDMRTAIKILCFLSLLFEKIDKRVP